jgi:hypothetical protein
LTKFNSKRALVCRISIPHVKGFGIASSSLVLFIDYAWRPGVEEMVACISLRKPDLTFLIRLSRNDIVNQGILA